MYMFLVIWYVICTVENSSLSSISVWIIDHRHALVAHNNQSPNDQWPIHQFLKPPYDWILHIVTHDFSLFGFPTRCLVDIPGLDLSEIK